MTSADMFLPILIFLVVIGPAVGNYACSVVYRLPRGRTPFERHPYCGHCNADLKPCDLFPILSWLSTRGRCRYCHGAIPGVYTVIELACLLLFVGYFLLLGMNAWFLLAVTLGVCTVMIAAIQWQQGWISSSLYGYAFLLAGLLRYEWGEGLFDWLLASFVVLVACLGWQRLVTALMRAPLRPFETPWIWWMVLISAIIPHGMGWLLIPPAVILGVFRLLPPAARPWALLPVSFYALLMPVCPVLLGLLARQ